VTRLHDVPPPLTTMALDAVRDTEAIVSPGAFELGRWISQGYLSLPAKDCARCCRAIIPLPQSVQR
jgi:hypothetical protein